MAYSQEVLDKISAETAEYRVALERQGMLTQERTEEELEGVFTQLYLSIPDVMAKWSAGLPMAIFVVRDDHGQASLYYTEPKTADDEPLLFEIQDYTSRLKEELKDQSELSLPVIAMGYFGECIRGSMAGSPKAVLGLSKFLKFLFPDKSRVFLQLGVEGGEFSTLTVDGYFTDV